MSRKLLVMVCLFISGTGCSSNYVDRSFLNHPGMDFNYSATLPPNNEKTVLGSANSQKSESGCSTCAY